MVTAYKIHDLVEYIDWLYFFYAWKLGAQFGQISEIHGCDSCRAQWLTSFPEEERPKAAEAMQLYKEANRMLDELDKDFEVKVMYELFDSNSDGDNLIVGNVVIPFLRQQTRKKDNEPYLCLSDFVRPLSSGQKDTVGIFASSVDPDMEKIYENDPYKHILVQTLTDRLAEAAVEKMHEHVRKVAWGYAKDENLTIKEMLKVKYQGIRPAVGYPSIPDQSINFLLNDLIDMSRIGIRLTENGAMYPHASVSGIMISHPASSYFSIGKIGEDQLNDYARRRGMEVSEIRKFLAANL
ncbi:vitamin B12 dependent-methionine synthase activation domain-containing protein [uncultured Bacteroides sp.]|uniref:vitamin B12 dependent-methionine synthase activation domain-containing protein n=1 Tax=uncultured Bacteroides sp. TaxID=162156 RepID=UPI002AA86C58|nr:vitamin B12 dependent-methionine synthase activation domain-containing protein [uncultured Bacteroides sp.]